MNRSFLVVGIFAIMFQFCFAPVVDAKLYTWVDKNGVTRRTYYPPPADQVKKKSQSQKTSVQRQKKKARNQVELYVTDWCPYCKQAISYLKSKGIKARVYDIEKDKKAAARKKKLAGGKSGVPFAVINGKKISGFSPEGYSRALK